MSGVIAYRDPLTVFGSDFLLFEGPKGDLWGVPPKKSQEPFKAAQRNFYTDIVLLKVYQNKENFIYLTSTIPGKRYII